ncbi:WD40-repeat-containing domain protein [Aspergillus crustosus]
MLANNNACICLTRTYYITLRLGNSVTPPLLGSSDSSLIEESKNLLSKFIIRGPSQEAQDAQSQPSITRKPTAYSAVMNTPPKERVKILRGNVQLRPPSIPQLKATPDKPHRSLGPRIKQTVVLPCPRTKPPKSPPPPMLQASRSSSPASDVFQTTVARRSRRSKVKPHNYFKKISLFASDSEEDTTDFLRVSAPKHLLQHHPGNNGAPAPAKRATRQQENSQGSLLQQRELGSCLNQQVQAMVTSNLRISKTWKGASNDVVSLAWSPDGTRFAAGATAQCDEHMMAYNRRNNLLVGDLVWDELHELAEHWIPRPKDRDPASHTVTDLRLFMSTTAVQWFEHTLYTASYDHTVKLWDTRNRVPSCFKTLNHDSKVIVMARSIFAPNLLATGAGTLGYWDTNQAQYTALELPRPRAKKDLDLVPTSVAWGTNQLTKDYLLTGMSGKEDTGVIAQHGLLTSFRFGESSVVPESFQPKSQNVFDVTWHPVLPSFAAACTAGQQASHGTYSVVNLFDPLRLKSRTMELECPARDMNEVVFCPIRAQYVSASCTDGITYVWDQRNCGQVLHTLKHGEPLNQLDETMKRELADTGVNLHLWGSTFEQLYTGASDGFLKRWNILRAPEDVLVEDVASLNEGIMCGSFSPDQSNLLVGDVAGGIHLLSNSSFSPERPSFTFRETPHTFDQGSLDSGIRAARELISSGQIVQHPIFGPGKGPGYKGPFAAWARPNGTPRELIASTRLTEEYEMRQISGAPPRNRRQLARAIQNEVEGHTTLARIRNQTAQKKRHSPVTIKQKAPEDLVVKRPKVDVSRAIINNVEVEVIDLTGDTEIGSITNHTTYQKSDPTSQASAGSLDDLDEDFWWPESGKTDPNFHDD